MWKKLTFMSGVEVMVNFDLVLYMYETDKRTVITFTHGANITVKETMQEIDRYR